MTNKSVCIYFQVHQPWRLSKLNILNIGKSTDVFEGFGRYKNFQIFNKVAEKCYLPVNKILSKIIKKYPEFKCAFSFSGTFLEQAQKYNKKVINSFKKLVNSKNVEILSETYYHSLASLYSKNEFLEQIKLHRSQIWNTFRRRPKIFRNTELIYTDEIAEFVRLLGFVGILAEGWDPLMNGKSSNYLYYAKKTTLEPKIQKIAEKNCISKRKLPKIRVLLKNYKLSDDVAFRFSDRTWNEYPLTAEKFVEWILKSPGNTINLFVDYETFGEHQWESTGIFKFLEDLPLQFKKLNIGFKTPIETINSYRPAFEFSSEKPLSWADESRDLSAWMGNKLQKTAMKNLYELEYKIYNLKKPDKKSVLLEFWRRLQTSDHFYYMSTKYWNDGDVHKYFSPYDSPYDAYINFMNVLNELVEKIEKEA